MTKALSGTTVVEVSANLGVAYAAMLLAEQGARALKLEPPHGAPGRGTPHFAVLNRSKGSVCLDLETRDGRAQLATLVRDADIVITGATPKRLSALGLDYATLARENRRIIALNIPALGSRGPDAEVDANDELVAARGGITGTQWARSGSPVALTIPASSYSAGVLGATAAAAALYARGADGPGQSVEVSLLAGAFSLQTGGILRHEKMQRLYHGPQDPLGPIPCYRLFEASDGRYLFVACGNATFWGKFAIAIERPELVSDPRFERAPWGIPQEHWQTLKDLLEPIMRTRTRDEWLRILRDNDVPCAAVTTRAEFIDDPQVRALDMRREIEDPALGRTVQMGVPVVLNDTPGEIAGAAPRAGDDRRGFADAAAAPRLASRVARNPSKGPLTGALVLDFASYIAGSYGPMILAQLGADVIKIESPAGDSFRAFGFGFLGWNQGKRGLALDLTTPEGREIILALAEKADVVVENLRPGRMRRYGFDYQTLAARNPRIIYMSVNAFGNRGPEHDQPGFDPLLQARSGVMAAQGGAHGHPVYLTCAICDYGAAMLSALGCVLALNARDRTGRGQFCETSLLQASIAFQAGEYVLYKGRPDMENGGAESRGRAALARAYQCRDGEWLFVSVSGASEWRAVRALHGSLPALSFEDAVREPSEGGLAAALAEQFSKIDRADALAALARAGVPAARVNHFHDLFDDAQVVANELVAEFAHAEWGTVRQTGILAKFSATPARVDRAAPLLGEHTDEILRDLLGYDAATIADLRARGVVK